MDVCVTIIAVLILGPIVLRLLGAILRGLGPLLKLAVAAVIVLGIASLAFGLVKSVISGVANLIFGPLGLLLIGGTAVYLAYREWQKRNPAPLSGGDVVAGEKPKRSASRIGLGDDGEIVTLDELLGDEPEKRKRGG